MIEYNFAFLIWSMLVTLTTLCFAITFFGRFAPVLSKKLYFINIVFTFIMCLLFWSFFHAELATLDPLISSLFRISTFFLSFLILANQRFASLLPIQMSNIRQISILLTISLMLTILLIPFSMQMIPDEELDLVPPVFSYEHECLGIELGCSEEDIGLGSVTGGYVYRGSIDSLYGKYIFADMMLGKIWSFDSSNNTTELIYEFNEKSGLANVGIIRFVENSDSELLFIGYYTGKIYSLEYSDKIEIVEIYENVSFERPHGIFVTPGFSSDIIVTEKSGKVYILKNQDGEITKRIILDLSSKVEDYDWEQGLYSVAFDPDFDENNVFYVTYTSNPKGNLVLSSFILLDETNHTLETQSVLLEVEQPGPKHNGGHIIFGPDGYLYLGLGEGSLSNPGGTLGHSQNLESLLGSLLRLEVYSSGYNVPNNNPFYNNSYGYSEEIYAYGFRNPWSFSFDSETGDLWLGDVGQQHWEEINLIVSGGNYGWAYFEGENCYESDNEIYEGYECKTLKKRVDPVATVLNSLSLSFLIAFMVFSFKTKPIFSIFDIDYPKFLFSLLLLLFWSYQSLYGDFIKSDLTDVFMSLLGFSIGLIYLLAIINPKRSVRAVSVP